MVASNQTFILGAYAVTWVVLLGYQWRLSRKDGRARAEYERMEPDQGGGTGR